MDNNNDLIELQEKYDELKQTCKDLGKQIKKLKEVKSTDNNAWIPKEHDEYYYLNRFNDIVWDNYFSKENEYDLNLLYNNNIFKTKEEAEKFADIDFKFKKLVFEENQKNPIDWNKFSQLKYCIGYDYKSKSLCYSTTEPKYLNDLCCTNSNILQLAKDLIGEDDLIWYIKRG